MRATLKLSSANAFNLNCSIISLFGKELALSQTIQSFDILEEEGLQKYYQKNADPLQFLHFPQCFLPFHRHI